jgi:hypothetical protein
MSRIAPCSLDQTEGGVSTFSHPSFLARFLRISALPLAVLLVVAFAASRARAQDPNAEPARDRQLSQLSSAAILEGFEEDIDHFTGRVTLRITPIDLLVRAGQRLKVQIYYNSDVWNRTDFAPTHVASVDTADHLGGTGWQLHMGKIINPGGQGSPPGFADNPLLILQNGATKRLFNAGDGLSEMITEDRWRYDYNPTTQRWEVTDTEGTVYEFAFLENAGTSSMRGEIIAQCVEITDVHGNVIHDLLA